MGIDHEKPLLSYTDPFLLGEGYKELQHLEQKLFVKEKQLLYVLLLRFPESSFSYVARNNSSLNRSRVTQGSVAPSAKKVVEYALYQALYFLNLLTSLLLSSSP